MPEPAGSPFQLTCAEGSLTVTQSLGRRNVDALLLRPYETGIDLFNLEFVTTSLAAAGLKVDQNAYGIFFEGVEGNAHALRIQAQAFRFETWLKDAESGTVKFVNQLDLSYSPTIKPAGQKNYWRLACQPGACSLFANHQLIGTYQTEEISAIQTFGLFSASAWDEQIGQVVFSELLLEGTSHDFQPYEYMDDLKSNRGAFAQSGLSGAFNEYTDSGFAFSPVIPFGVYGAKSGPSLQDVEVQATVKMEINPDRPGSQYAGLICRSSLAGTYMAVIGVDGTYTIYRDTPKKPFTRLAEKKTAAILAGESSNLLRLVCSGPYLSFYINDQLVESLNDSRSGLNFGRAGLFTKAGGEPQPDVIIFSDFSIRSLP